MGNIVSLFETDCQEIQYCYDFTTCLRHAAIEEDRHLIEAVKSALTFDPLETFYWIEDESNPGLKREDLVLDAEILDNSHVRMEIHPSLFRHPEVIDLKAVYFCVHGKELGEGDSIKLGQIGFIWVAAFLKDDLRARIREDKLRIYDPKILEEGEPKKEEKKTPAAAPRKKGKVRRLQVAPADVIKEGKRLELWECWLKIYRQMYRRSRFRKLRDVPHYPRETTRKGRYYFCGIAYLARICGLDERTIKRVLHKLEDAKLIYIRYKGYKGRGCSIIELPVNMKLVWKWRREHKGLKVSTLLGGGGF